MDPRQFFTSHRWWGKFIGISLGYLFFGPSGALFGLLIGNLFDRSIVDYYTRPYWTYHAEKRGPTQKIFFQSTFSIMGHISKADGRVTEDQIRMVKRLMNDMRLTKQQQIIAQNYFREGAKKNFDLWPDLTSLRTATKGNAELLKLFVDLQFKIALVGGLSVKKQNLLNTILIYLGFAPLQQQQRFYEEFTTSNTYQNNYSNTGHQQSSNDTDHAYSILEITRSTSKVDVKRAYRRLMSQNHPDKLIAKGASESMIKIANEKTQKIRKAYEQICVEKGW